MNQRLHQVSGTGLPHLMRSVCAARSASLDAGEAEMAKAVDHVLCRPAPAGFLTKALR